MKKIFITSTGTNIGKTLVTCGLTHLLRSKYQSKVHVVKPVVSGFNFNNKPNDLLQICSALNIVYSKENIKKLTRYFFEKPLSPDMAARLEKADYASISEINKFCSFKNIDYLIIEGAGGAFVPINETENTAHLIKKTADKIILVFGSYLGSLSHTIATFKAMQAEKITPDIIIATENLNKNHELYIPVKETIKSLENFITKPIIRLDRVAKIDHKNIAKALTKTDIIKFLK